MTLELSNQVPTALTERAYLSQPGVLFPLQHILKLFFLGFQFESAELHFRNCLLQVEKAQRPCTLSFKPGFNGSRVFPVQGSFEARSLVLGVKLGWWVAQLCRQSLEQLAFNGDVVDAGGGEDSVDGIALALIT